MKKIVLLFTLFFSVLVFGIQANAQINLDGKSFDYESVELYTQPTNSSDLLAYNRSSTIDILVQASSTVNDLCNYFNGSWLDAGLTFYCAFAGDLYTCTLYKVVKAACGINGVVYLTLQGDFSGAVKNALKTSATLWGVTKMSQNKYKLYEVAKNYCPR